MRIQRFGCWISANPRVDFKVHRRFRVFSGPLMQLVYSRGSMQVENRRCALWLTASSSPLPIFRLHLFHPRLLTRKESRWIGQTARYFRERAHCKAKRNFPNLLIFFKGIIPAPSTSEQGERNNKIRSSYEYELLNGICMSMGKK